MATPTIDPITGLPSSNTQQLQAGDLPTPPTPKGAVTSPYTGYTSSQAPATVTTSPVAVVSSSMATNDYNSRVLPGYNQIKTNLQNYNSNKPTINLGSNLQWSGQAVDKNGNNLGYRGLDGNLYPTQEEAQSKKYQGGDGKYYATQEEAIMNTPSDGHVFAYDANGQRTTIKNGEQLPQGYSLTPMSTGQTATATESVDDSSGGSIRKLADGTYVQFDNNGQMVGKTNELVFNNLKQANKTSQDIANMANGSFTLSDGEKAQIASIRAIYAKTIRDTQNLYSNMAGGQAILQNLYGMGNNMIGQGEINGVVQKGIQAVNDLNVEMEAKVAEMTQAFKDKNMAALKTAYDTYSKKETDRLAAITKMKDDLSLISRETQQQKATADAQTDNDIRGLISTATQHGATPEQIQQMQVALQNHDYAAAAQAGGDTLLTASGIAGEYYTYVRDEQSRGTPKNQIMSFNQYQTADANRKARIAAAGVNATTGMNPKQTSVFNSIIEHQNKSPLIMAADRASVLKDITEAVANDPTNSALQVSFIYSMIQALDTYQSAVREGEINLVAGTQGLQEKIQNLPDKINSGTPLNPTAIARYVDVSKKLTSSIDSAAQKKKNVFKAQAISNGIGEQYTGWDNTITELNRSNVVDKHKENVNSASSASDEDVMNRAAGVSGSGGKGAKDHVLGTFNKLGI